MSSKNSTIEIPDFLKYSVVGFLSLIAIGFFYQFYVNYSHEKRFTKQTEMIAEVLNGFEEIRRDYVNLQMKYIRLKDQNDSLGISYIEVKLKLDKVTKVNTFLSKNNSDLKDRLSEYVIKLGKANATIAKLKNDKNDLADKLAKAPTEEERKRLRNELARLNIGLNSSKNSIDGLTSELDDIGKTITSVIVEVSKDDKEYNEVTLGKRLKSKKINFIRFSFSTGDPTYNGKVNSKLSINGKVRTDEITVKNGKGVYTVENKRKSEMILNIFDCISGEKILVRPITIGMKGGFLNWLK